ncbi:MAG: GntR family transcriptional regulator [Epsilonproteobacteria bacterium]|nr:GntR family transcriptional regulator [Campylobacterota bacterium]
MTKKFDYEIIYEYLKNKIQNDLQCNDKIPSENELCTVFNLTRATVRQGINKLKNEGLIFSKQGSGYFVTPPKINYTLSQKTTFSHEIIKLGKAPNIKILEMQTLTPNDFILEKFNMKESQSILKITLIRLADETPILLGISYLNTALLPNIDLKIASITSFTKTFEEYGLEPIRDYSELEIVPSDDEYMQLLQIQNNLPLIKIASGSTDAKSGQVIEYVESYFRSDLVRISIDFNNQKGVTTL